VKLVQFPARGSLQFIQDGGPASLEIPQLNMDSSAERNRASLKQVRNSVRASLMAQIELLERARVVLRLQRLHAPGNTPTLRSQSAGAGTFESFGTPTQETSTTRKNPNGLHVAWQSFQGSSMTSPAIAASRWRATRRGPRLLLTN